MSRSGDGHVLVAGAGGFIGGHLVRALLDEGTEVRATDLMPLERWQQTFDEAENVVLDLRDRDACRQAVRGVSAVFNLAADMGGIGYIETFKASCMLSVLINTHLLIAASDAGVDRYFYASSACVYPDYRQDDPDVVALREDDAYPAMPEDGYGWEKLFSERMCRHFREELDLETRVARYHNVYGPHGTFDGGREKAPAAICRKVAQAVLAGRHEIEIWGDGRQTRSFTYIDDCVEGTLMVARGDYPDALNVGSSELVTIDQLVDTAEEAAGVTLERIYDPTAPQGVRGRNSDNRLIRSVYGWEPSTPLAEGMEATYGWVHSMMSAHAAVSGRP